MYTNFNKKQHHYESTKLSLSNEVNVNLAKKKQMSLPQSPHESNKLGAGSTFHIVDQVDSVEKIPVDGARVETANRQLRHNSHKELSKMHNNPSFLNEASEDPEENDIKLSGQYNHNH